MTENQRLKLFRERLGYNQKLFAERVGMQPGSLSDVERGKVGVSPKLKKILYLLFLLNIEWLESGKGDMQHYDNISSEDQWVGVFISDSLKSVDIEKIIEISGNTLPQLMHCINNEDIAGLSNKAVIVQFITHADNYKPNIKEYPNFEPFSPKLLKEKEYNPADENRSDLIKELRILIKEKDKRIADKEAIIKDKEEIISLLKQQLATKSTEEKVNKDSDIGTL